jgi:hypothetical protein
LVTVALFGVGTVSDQPVLSKLCGRLRSQPEHHAVPLLISV